MAVFLLVSFLDSFEFTSNTYAQLLEEEKKMCFNFLVQNDVDEKY